MRKSFTKIICFTAAIIVTLGVALFSACGKNKVNPLTPDNLGDAAVTSNGGFAVEKGDYVYFINGKENYTADNGGNAVKGAIMRISKADLSAHNYSSVDTVVPSVIYSGNSNAGLYIYGDRIYYTTPSTEKNSDGEVQNSYLQFKSTKLDRTDTVKNYYLQLADNSTEYRYVEVDGTVYILYVAASENLYGTSCKNIHSYNTANGVDTLLAYNVGDVTFDKYDLTNPRIYYTMNVTDYVTNTSYSEYYNQIYSVTADETQRNEYGLDKIVEDYDAEKDPLYVNCGSLVFDGIGKVQGMTQSVTPFNGEGADSVERSAYKYTVSAYENGYLYYTRTTKQNSTAMLFAAKQSEILSEGWKPVSSNPEDGACLVRDGSSASSYIYLYGADNALTGALVTGSNGIEKVNVKDGKIGTVLNNEDRFYLTTDGQATPLFTAKHDDGNYIYYSLTGGNGYTVHRVCYDGGYLDYSGFPLEDAVGKYTPVQVLDVDASSNWYKPEFVDNQLLFPAQTADMVSYEYIMVCDLGKDGKMMTNAQIDELNDQFESIEKKITEVDDKTYENLQNALRYAFFTGESEYIGTLIQAYVDIQGKDVEYLWSEESVAKYHEFVKAEKLDEWVDVTEGRATTVKVNGKDIAANKRDYYYSLLGKMSDKDSEAYAKSLRDQYLQSYPEKPVTPDWYSTLSKGAKIGFIVGVSAGGAIILAGASVLTVYLVRKRRKKMPTYVKRSIKVDTTDDKNIDVYSTGEDESSADGE